MWAGSCLNVAPRSSAIYRRLNVSFDEELGESFYHDRLGAVVDDFVNKGLATESEGATCVFLDGFEAPMIIRKKDGAFLYATSDLATIQYRMERWSPDAILYVVDFRQADHFEKLFAAARQWGIKDVELRHIEFGTVLGDDGKPFKTRAGDTVGLESLLDAAVQHAAAVVNENDDAKPNGAELSAEQREQIANIVGHAAIKYADLSQNRASDYVYSEEKMVALRGNTATYLQYSYARVKSIFARGEIDIDALRQSGAKISLEHEKERALGLQILRFSEALQEVSADYRPNHLTNYLFDLATLFSGFFEACPVIKAESAELRNSRALLCDLVAQHSAPDCHCSGSTSWKRCSNLARCRDPTAVEPEWPNSSSRISTRSIVGTPNISFAALRKVLRTRSSPARPIIDNETMPIQVKSVRSGPPSNTSIVWYPSFDKQGGP